MPLSLDLLINHVYNLIYIRDKNDVGEVGSYFMPMIGSKPLNFKKICGP